MLAINIVKQTVLVLVGATVGGLFYLLLPYAWIVVGVIMLAKMTLNGFILLAERSGGFGWRPLQSYFTGRKEQRRRK